MNTLKTLQIVSDILDAGYVSPMVELQLQLSDDSYDHLKKELEENFKPLPDDLVDKLKTDGITMNDGTSLKLEGVQINTDNSPIIKSDESNMTVRFGGYIFGIHREEEDCVLWQMCEHKVLSEQ